MRRYDYYKTVISFVQLVMLIQDRIKHSANVYSSNSTHHDSVEETNRSLTISNHKQISSN